MLGLFWTFYGLVAIRRGNRYARVPTCHAAPLTIRRDGRRVEAEARGGSRRRVCGRGRARAAVSVCVVVFGGVRVPGRARAAPARGPDRVTIDPSPVSDSPGGSPGA